jgi:hypothetical protein
MKDLADASPSAVANYLHARKGVLCSQCKEVMSNGYCEDPACPVYGDAAQLFLAKFSTSLLVVHRDFKRKKSTKHKPSKLVSGGRFESKRRKH